MEFEIQNMTAMEFIQFRIDVITEEISDLILELERLSHSPNELGFTAGRITELNYEIILLKKYLKQWQDRLDEEDLYED